MNTFTKRGEIAGPAGPLSVAVDTTTEVPTAPLVGVVWCVHYLLSQRA